MKILWPALSLVVVTVLAVLLWGAATGTERVEVVRDGVAVTGAPGSSPDRSPDGSPEAARDGRGLRRPRRGPVRGPVPGRGEERDGRDGRDGRAGRACGTSRSTGAGAGARAARSARQRRGRRLRSWSGPVRVPGGPRRGRPGRFLFCRNVLVESSSLPR